MLEVRFIDLFSGIGGFRLGLEKANWQGGLLRQQDMHGGRADADECLEHGGEASSGDIAQEPHYYYRCVWSCDNDKYANQIYTKRFGGENHHAGDIEGVDSEAIPDFDLLCAGFPCQAFSVAGKRKGFKDTRGTLFFEICRIAEAKRPALLLLENVKGLLNHDGGRTFTVILQSLDELGYWLEWQVLNSKHFGVPQNRERVFLIGHLRGTGGREVFPITETDELSSQESERGQGIASCLDSNYRKGARRQRTFVIRPENDWFSQHAIYSEKGMAPTLRGQQKDSAPKIIRWQNKKDGAVLDNMAPSLRASGGTDIRKKPVVFHENIGKNISIRDETVALRSGASHNYQGIVIYRHPFNYGKKAIYELDETYPSLRTVQRNPSPNIFHQNIGDFRIRRLTPVECERLQGFPDGWTGGLSDTQRYKCLGNAVTVNVIEYLGARILDRCFNTIE